MKVSELIALLEREDMDAMVDIGLSSDYPN